MTTRADRFTVVIDTNALVGALTRNMLLSLAEAGLFRPRWSNITLNEEFERVFARRYPDGAAVGQRQRANIDRAFPEAVSIVDAKTLEAIDLPDPDDRHVLAAAIQTKAALIVTDNLKDFPADHLLPHEIEAISLDDFLADCIDLAGPEAIAALRAMRERYKDPEIDAEALILKVESLGLGQTATLLGAYKSLL